MDKPIKAMARITRNTRLLFEGAGEIVLEDGSIAATGYAKHYKMKIDKIIKEMGMKMSLLLMIH